MTLTKNGEEVEETPVLPKQKRCVCHKGSLVATNDGAFKNVKFDNQRIATNSMDKSRALWRKSKWSGELIYEIIGKHLDVPCDVRWGSHHAALEDLLQLKPEVMKKLTQALAKKNKPKDKEKNKVRNFTESELKFLKGVLNSFRSF